MNFTIFALTINSHSQRGQAMGKRPADDEEPLLDPDEDDTYEECASVDWFLFH